MVDTLMYRNPAKDIPILGSYDVIVVGGGPSGCAAAIYAARHGSKTLLVEKDGYLGGATVSQLVGHILSTNGVDFQGIWYEWIRAVKKRGGLVEHGIIKNKNKWRSGVDPEIVKYAWDDLLKSASVDILHHAYFSDAIIDKEVIKGIVIETKGGSKALYAKRVVDATGDAMVCAKSGVPWEQGNGINLYNQALTKVFRMGNVNRTITYTEEYINELCKLLDTPEIKQKYTTKLVLNGQAIKYSTNSYVPKSIPEYRNEMNIFASMVLKVDPLNPWELSQAEREGREQAWECADFIRKYVKGFEKSYLLDSNAHIGLRDSRRIHGIETATKDDAMNLRKYPDSIAKSSWHIDLWPGDSYNKPAVPKNDRFYQERMNKTENGDYFDIRYGCLIPQKIDNLLVAGRCISAEREAQGSLRIQQTCQATGQAAGTAAALSLKEDICPRELDPMKVVSQLKKDRENVESKMNMYKDL